MPARFTVIDVLRRFLPPVLKTKPRLSPQQRRALWAITHCRTPALGGRRFDCKSCARQHFAFHSCNHKGCPLCGSTANATWVQREQRKRLNAPYFLVTFTLPAELRSAFFGPHAREAYDLFFAAVSRALSQKLATNKGLRAAIHGFTAVLHTWNQQLGFHPHVHCLVPGVGVDARGRLVRVKNPQFLVYRPQLQSAFRQHFYRLLKEQAWQVDPVVWDKNWGVHIQPAGSGRSALKYLGTYVARTAINDARLAHVTDQSVTFRWKNRTQGKRRETATISGGEFVARYLRHVLPRGLRSIRHYGFCHPAAKANRMRLQFHTGLAVEFGAAVPSENVQSKTPLCAGCGKPMHLVRRLSAAYKERGPPAAEASTPLPRTTPSLGA